MSSIVIELQQELLKSDCNVLNALRKAHLIASKLKLIEFDSWIQCELYGYKERNIDIPIYRQMRGELKANNPRVGWIPIIVVGPYGNSLYSIPMYESLSVLIDIMQKSTDGYFRFTYPPETTMKICELANTPTYMEIALFIGVHCISEVVEQVRNCLLEWTLELEGKGILGENLTFNQSESAAASEISQQINNYYLGQVVNGNVSGSQLVSGDNNTVTYNDAEVLRVLKETREALNQDKISEDDMASAIELLEEISSKIDQKKKPGIIKAALSGLKDFLINTGANVAASVITTYLFQ